ncbi:hypothetical protein AV530_013204 [Patagioenas fasciata monilis]|uniref:Uncharacterized protein n=1 Tax=Patagioenas fasciata monilis TaxID=372326 RepID=A0A1V4JNF4_PATFA|nr:hypothetical protein AV530_013204 [Patagioenas fasciata monilis]
MATGELVSKLGKLSSREEIITEQGCRSPESKPLPHLLPQAPFFRGLCSVSVGHIIQALEVGESAGRENQYAICGRRGRKELELCRCGRVGGRQPVLQ